MGSFSIFSILPVKEPRINCFCQAISADCCTLGIEASFYNFLRGDHDTLTQCIFQGTSIAPNKAGNPMMAIILKAF